MTSQNSTLLPFTSAVKLIAPESMTLNSGSQLRLISRRYKIQQRLISRRYKIQSTSYSDEDRGRVS